MRPVREDELLAFLVLKLLLLLLLQQSNTPAAQQQQRLQLSLVMERELK